MVGCVAGVPEPRLTCSAEVIRGTAASPGELRLPGEAARLPWSALLALALLVGCVGVLCAAVVHSAA
jgi:hypothetical protein